MRRAVFLDRDGVVNRAILREGRPFPPVSPDELEMLPGVTEACQRLHHAGFLLILVTNQPDVARGRQRRDTVQTINDTIRARLALDDVRVCYHDDADRCACRKPKPGLLIDAARDWSIDLGASYMVGDRWRDIEAGRAAGCTTIFLDRHYDETQPTSPDCTLDTLEDAAAWILGAGRRRRPRGRRRVAAPGRRRGRRTGSRRT